MEKKVLWHRQTLDVSVRSAHDHTKYTDAHHVSFNNFNLLIGDQCAREADQGEKDGAELAGNYFFILLLNNEIVIFEIFNDFAVFIIRPCIGPIIATECIRSQCL